MKFDNPLIQEAVDTFPESVSTNEALLGLEEKTFSEIMNLSNQLVNTISNHQQKMENLTTKYCTVKELRRIAPVVSLK